MILLLIKRNDEELDLVSPETYGMATWGSFSHQEGIEKKDDGKWYFEWWSSGNEWIEDTNEELEINVLLETKDLDDILSYVRMNNPKYIQKILSAAKEIYNDFIDFTSWCLKGESK